MISPFAGERLRSSRSLQLERRRSLGRAPPPSTRSTELSPAPEARRGADPRQAPAGHGRPSDRKGHRAAARTRRMCSRPRRRPRPRARPRDLVPLPGGSPAPAEPLRRPGHRPPQPDRVVPLFIRRRRGRAVRDPWPRPPPAGESTLTRSATPSCPAGTPLSIPPPTPRSATPSSHCAASSPFRASSSSTSSRSSSSQATGSADAADRACRVRELTFALAGASPRPRARDHGGAVAPARG